MLFKNKIAYVIALTWETQIYLRCTAYISTLIRVNVLWIVDFTLNASDMKMLFQIGMRMMIISDKCIILCREFQHNCTDSIFKTLHFIAFWDSCCRHVPWRPFTWVFSESHVSSKVVVRSLSSHRVHSRETRRCTACLCNP